MEMAIAAELRSKAALAETFGAVGPPAGKSLNGRLHRVQRFRLGSPIRHAENPGSGQDGCERE